MQAKYQTISKMEPRPGQKHSTDYIKQTRRDHEDLDKEIEKSCELITIFLDEFGLNDFADSPNSNLTRHRAGELNGRHYTITESMTDLLQVQTERGRQGQPKDYPRAKIDRWNRAIVELSRRPEAQYKIPNMDITWDDYFQNGGQIELVPRSELSRPEAIARLFE